MGERKRDQKRRGARYKAPFLGRGRMVIFMGGNRVRRRGEPVKGKLLTYREGEGERETVR